MFPSNVTMKGWKDGCRIQLLITYNIVLMFYNSEMDDKSPH